MSGRPDPARLDIEAIQQRVKLAQRMYGVSFDGYPDLEREPVDIQRDRDRAALLREVDALRAEVRQLKAKNKEKILARGGKQAVSRNRLPHRNDGLSENGAIAQLLAVERELRESLRGGYLFGNFDEPLDAAGLRTVRVIQQRLSDLPCECTDRTPDGARCRACGGRIYADTP